MKAVKWIVIAAVAYVGIVVLFETWLGVFQPKGERSGIPMLVLTTTDASGASHDRRLARMESGGRLYVSAHHWPRAWHRRALENPPMRVAVPVDAKLSTQARRFLGDRLVFWAVRKLAKLP